MSGLLERHAETGRLEPERSGGVELPVAAGRAKGDRHKDMMKE